jgi:D-tagatose-1,6-bisphosphate aldolase subunit GatZ/KbaZ
MASSPQRDNPGDSVKRLQFVLRENRQSGEGGTYAVCSAHPAVIEAAIHQSIADESLLHVESTSSQVNQFGGYTSMAPGQFADWIYSSARSAGLPSHRILLGGDHLGPFPWRKEASSVALEKACGLVRDCVAAGYQKIHLDASMACANDPAPALPEQTIAARAALLCQVAEDTHREMPIGSPSPVYVIGTEVPTPGGESHDPSDLAVTKAEDVHRSMEAFHSAFATLGLHAAWERVIALVVQPGVDFAANSIIDYDCLKARSLSEALSSHPCIVFEAHSTDYQSPQALTQMVEDHFSILKVGPWLTFAFREAVLALSAMERELLGKAHRRSQVREALEAAMLHDPSQWQPYYHGDEDEVRRDRVYSFSDRCRYYWHQSAVQDEFALLLNNLRSSPIPLSLVSQFLPAEYEAIRTGELQALPEQLIQHHIGRVLQIYAGACRSTNSRGSLSE